MLNTDMTMYQAFQDAAASRPETAAVICGGNRLTYRELQTRADALAGGLGSLGVEKGDRVLTLLPAGDSFATIFFALAGLGAVVVPMSSQTRPRQLRHVVGDCEPVLIVAEWSVLR